MQMNEVFGTVQYHEASLTPRSTRIAQVKPLPKERQKLQDTQSLVLKTLQYLNRQILLCANDA